jgi:predicted methyltransferase
MPGAEPPRSRARPLAESGDLALPSGMISCHKGSVLFVSAFAFGCAPEPSPPPAAPAAHPAVTITALAAEPVAPPPPSPEELKRAADLKKLQDDRAQFEQDKQAELLRWTPELHTAAKILASATYSSGHAAIEAAIAGKYRRPGNAARDAYRHPLETLDFLGFKPTMTVLEVGPGEGWYTELLAPSLAKKGKLLVTISDPNGPVDQRNTLNGQRFKAFLDTAPELYGKVETLIVDGNAPVLGLDKSVDLVLLMREVHGMYSSKTLGAWLTQCSRTLKPGGILGIEEHRAKPDSNPDETAPKGYMPEKWVIDQVQAAGFKFVAKSEVNANSKDTKDYPDGVWSLPPTYRGKEVNRDRYQAIGESDRMTLKFVKPADTK